MNLRPTRVRRATINAKPICILTALFLGACVVLGGQSASRLSFEVASVKAVSDEPAGSTGIAPPIDNNSANLTWRNVSLVGVLCRAYNLRPPLIHAPEWMTSRRYAIMAKAPAGAPKGHVPEMVQNLLADRFQMKLHGETKSESGYSLVLGKEGAKLKKSAAGAARSAGFESNGHQQWAASTMDDLAVSLSLDLDRPVANKTELPGEYDFALDAAPDSMPGFRMGNGRDSAFPSIFVAIRQLGLELVPGKVDTKYLVVDSALKAPTGN